jgi:hypothetical protein
LAKDRTPGNRGTGGTARGNRSKFIVNVLCYTG